MRGQLVVTVFVVICLKLADFALLGGPSNKDMFINAGYTKILYDKLASECPSYLTSTREVININHEAFTTIKPTIVMTNSPTTKKKPPTTKKAND